MRKKNELRKRELIRKVNVKKIFKRIHKGKKMYFFNERKHNEINEEKSYQKIKQ